MITQTVNAYSVRLTNALRFVSVALDGQAPLLTLHYTGERAIEFLRNLPPWEFHDGFVLDLLKRNVVWDLRDDRADLT